jgi:hypothetical protein
MTPFTKDVTRRCRGSAVRRFSGSLQSSKYQTVSSRAHVVSNGQPRKAGVATAASGMETVWYKLTGGLTNSGMAPSRTVFNSTTYAGTVSVVTPCILNRLLKGPTSCEVKARARLMRVRHIASAGTSSRLRTPIRLACLMTVRQEEGAEHASESGSFRIVREGSDR